MTKGAPGYPSTRQQCFIRRKSWSELLETIEVQWENKIITAIAYSKISEEYFAVMTESDQRQKICWDDCICERGFTPTVIFQDPVDLKVIYVCTEDVSNVDSWICYDNLCIKL